MFSYIIRQFSVSAKSCLTAMDVLSLRQSSYDTVEEITPCVKPLKT